MSNIAKVGLFMAICLVVLGGLVLQVESVRLFGGKTVRYDVLFDTVTGLDDKAAVRIAGVRIGRVDGVALDNRQARVRLVIEEPVQLPEGSYASIANVGLLGEKYIELFPGPAENPELPPGSTLPGLVPVSWDQAMAKISAIGDSVLQLTEGAAGDGGSSNLARLLDNLAAMSAELRDLVVSNRGQVDDTVASFQSFAATLAQELPRISSQMERSLREIETVIVENRTDFGEGMTNFRELTDGFKVTVANLNEITGSLAAGEGTLGKLLTSEEAHDNLVGALDSLEGGVEELRVTLGRIDKIKLDLGFEGYYLEDREDFRTSFMLDIDPGSKRFYRLAAVDDPRGQFKTSLETITTTVDGVSEVVTVERRRLEDKITISAQLGFEFGAFDLRGGLIESTGGGGVDWRDPSNRFRLSLEAFAYGRNISEGEDLAPRLRFTGKWLASDNVYVVGGYDDILESEFGSLFVGMGIRWGDDDLKYLLGSVPRF